MSLIRTRFCLGCLLALLLCGCASRLAVSPLPAAEDASAPNANSIYYYLVASVFAGQGNTAAADMLYQKALESDPPSWQIQRSILLNSFTLFSQGLLSAEELKSLIGQYSARIPPDEDILNANYGFYELIADSTALAQTVQELQKRFPTAKTYIQLFLYDYKHRSRTSLDYLDTASILAQNDPATLLNLARIYLYFDLDKAESTLQRLLDIAPSPEAHALLASVLLSRQNDSAVQSYFSSLAFPQDREYMQSFLDTALEAKKYDQILALEAQILPTKDLYLTHILAFAALIRNRPDVLLPIEEALPGLNSPPEEKQPLYSLLLAFSLGSAADRPLDSYTDQLSSSQAFEDILAYYGAALVSRLSETETELPPGAYDRLGGQARKRLREGPPARFLSAAVLSEQDSTFTGFADAKAQLILYLKARGSLSARDYEYLLQYYFNQGMAAARRALLDEASANYPYNPMFTNDLGYSLLIEGGDPEEAAKLIQRALDVEPENPYYLDSLAWYHYLRGNYVRAAELSEIPRNMENMPAEIAWHIGAIYFKLGDFPSARSYLEKCLAIGGDPQSAALAAQALQELP